MGCLNNNPLVEFHGIDAISDHFIAGLINRLVVILPLRKIDLTVKITLHVGKRNVTPTPGQAQKLFSGAEHSRGEKAIFALPSRNLKNESNILLFVDNFQNIFTFWETLDLVVT
jgi:hypothetical protein